MKKISLIFTLFSIITLKMCSDVRVHDDVQLSLSPTYSNGVLKLTPVVTYEGDEPAVFIYEDSIAWVESVKSDGEILYEYEESDLPPSEIRSTLEKDHERYGDTVEMKAEPGMYEVNLIAEYWLVTDGDEETKEKYYHTLKQSIEVKK